MRIWKLALQNKGSDILIDVILINLCVIIY